MAKNSFADWDTTANNNTDVAGINIAEGCAPSGINNAMRAIMAQLKGGVDGEVVYAAKSTNYTAVAADKNAHLRFSAAATLSLTAAATLATGWHVFVQADGGNVVIDPNSAELINGATTITLLNGQSAHVICTGTAFFAAISPGLAASNTFSGASGTTFSNPGDGNTLITLGTERSWFVRQRGTGSAANLSFENTSAKGFEFSSEVTYTGPQIIITPIGAGNSSITIEGNEVYHEGNVVAVADGGTGSTTAANARTNLGVDGKVVYAAKSGNYTALGTDNNAVHRYTATATVTLTAAATLATGWHYTVIADGANVTINPNGAETIDGAATLTVLDGSSVFIICDGSAFFSTVWRKIPTVQTFTANGTWTKPAGCKHVVVEAIGGGGGGGGTAAGAAGTAAAASGGASGFYGLTSPIDVTAIASGAVVIGALGAGGAAGANNGTQGGNTTITLDATTYTWGGAPGGVGVTANATPRIPQLGGSPTGTNVLGSGNRQGANGFSDGASNFAQGGYGSDSQFGTGGAAPRLVAAGATAGGAAGASNYGAGGAGAVSVSTTGNAAGGNGAAGFMKVTEFY